MNNNVDPCSDNFMTSVREYESEGIKTPVLPDYQNTLSKNRSAQVLLSDTPISEEGTTTNRRKQFKKA